MYLLIPSLINMHRGLTKDRDRDHSCYCNTALCEWLHQCVCVCVLTWLCFLLYVYCLHISQMHLFANLTCRATPEGFWLQRSGLPRRWESRWAACGWLARRNGRCAAGPWWSSAGSWPMHSACERESSDSRSPARNSRGEGKVNFSLFDQFVGVCFLLWRNPKHFYHCGGFSWHFSVKTKSAGRGRHLVALQTHLRSETADPIHPAPLTPSCHFACRGIAERSLLPWTANCTCRPVGVCHVRVFLGGESAAGGPLIIFNTAVRERLKTKSQLRKGLWGWSRAPRAVMQDERTLDSDCICDLSPLNLHPALSMCLLGKYISVSVPASLFHSCFSFIFRHLQFLYFLSQAVRIYDPRRCGLLVWEQENVMTNTSDVCFLWLSDSPLQSAQIQIWFIRVPQVDDTPATDSKNVPLYIHVNPWNQMKLLLCRTKWKFILKKN